MASIDLLERLAHQPKFEIGLSNYKFVKYKL